MESVDKKCRKCGAFKNIAEFYRMTASKDGLQPKCRECCNTANRAWAKANPEKARSGARAWALANAKRKLEKNKAWRAAHSEKFKADARAYVKAKRAVDLEFRIGSNLRRRLHKALETQVVRKASSAVRDLGCTISEFKLYLEKLFKPDMTWDNHGRNGWHIDHIRPLASFDLKDPEQQKLACHYTNLQPLWAHENLSKGDRWDGGNLNPSEQAPKD